MKQPLAGVTATAVIVIIALGFISIFTFPTFSGWVTYLIDCIIPVQIIVGVTWGARCPAFAASRTQPAKGVVLFLFTIAVAAVLAILFWITIGHSINPPTPVLIFFMIDLALSTFLLAIMWGNWPFVNLLKNPLATGLAVLAASVLVAYGIFLAFFNFSCMRQASFYSPRDPQGIFNAWTAMVYCVTVIAAMFFLISFDLWPLHLFPALMKQPLLGILWTGISAVIAAGVFYAGVTVMHADVVRFMVTVPIPFSFGTVIVLNMLQRSLFSKLRQPVKGLCNVLVVVAVGQILARIYRILMPSISGALSAGPPGYEFEIWLASALLSVTFPLLIFHAEFFKLWPLTETKTN